MAEAPDRKPVPIERRDGKLFKSTRQTSLKLVVLLIVAALIVGALMALGLKRIVLQDELGGTNAVAIVAAAEWEASPAL